MMVIKTIKFTGDQHQTSPKRQHRQSDVAGFVFGRFGRGSACATAPGASATATTASANDGTAPSSTTARYDCGFTNQ